MKHLMTLLTLLALGACSHVPRVVWDPVDEPQMHAKTQDAVYQPAPQMPDPAQHDFQKTHDVLPMQELVSTSDVTVYPLDRQTPNPFAGRCPGQGNGFEATTITDGG